MALSKRRFLDFMESVGSEGLIIDRDITGDALAREFGITGTSGRLLVDRYLGGEFKLCSKTSEKSYNE